jgi:hypothetical protein
VGTLVFCRAKNWGFWVYNWSGRIEYFKLEVHFFLFYFSAKQVRKEILTCQNIPQDKKVVVRGNSVARHSVSGKTSGHVAVNVSLKCGYCINKSGDSKKLFIYFDGCVFVLVVRKTSSSRRNPQKQFIFCLVVVTTEPTMVPICITTAVAELQRVEVAVPQAHTQNITTIQIWVS